jgi:hypothetical protein
MNGTAPRIKSSHKLACNLEGLLFSVDKTYRNCVTAVQSLHILGFSSKFIIFPLVAWRSKETKFSVDNTHGKTYFTTKKTSSNQVFPCICVGS